MTHFYINVLQVACKDIRCYTIDTVSDVAVNCHTSLIHYTFVLQIHLYAQKLTTCMTHNSCIFLECIFGSFLPSVHIIMFYSHDNKENAEPCVAERITMAYKHRHNSGFLPLFISVQFPNCNILFFFTLKTQPCTIQSSKSLLLQPQLKIVYPKPCFPVAHLSFFKDGERPAEVCQMDQQFYKARQ